MKNTRMSVVGTVFLLTAALCFGGCVDDVGATEQAVRSPSLRDHAIRPTVALALFPNAVLANGGGVILSRFTVTANPQASVALKKVSFQSSIVGAGTISAPAVREIGSGYDIPTAFATVDTASGNSCGFVSSARHACIQVVFLNERHIAAGTAKAYELRVTTSGFAPVCGNAINTKLLGDGDLSIGALASSGRRIVGPATRFVGESNFIWSDISAIPHDDAVGGSADWISGWLIHALPAATQTVTTQ